jgi:HEAT repeat protein
LLDHVADSRAVRPLIEVIRHDPLETVRRCALHSLVCDGCKECPLPADVVAALIEVMSCDRSLAVRRRAVFYLGHGRPDPRVVPALEGILAREQDPVLLQRARVALARHSAPPAGDAERCAVVSTV